MALKQSIRRRFHFIEAFLYEHGKIGRQDIIKRFEISIPQATNDLRNYVSMFPENIFYDRGPRCYLTKPDFNPYFYSPESDSFLKGMLVTLDEKVDQVDVLKNDIMNIRKELASYMLKKERL